MTINNIFSKTFPRGRILRQAKILQTLPRGRILRQAKILQTLPRGRILRQAKILQTLPRGRILRQAKILQTLPRGRILRQAKILQTYPCILTRIIHLDKKKILSYRIFKFNFNVFKKKSKDVLQIRMVLDWFMDSQHIHIRVVFPLFYTN